MSFVDIRHAQQEIWPQVQQSLDLHRAHREAVKADPNGATPAARARARRPWNRVVADEAVWAMAKSDRLLTDEQSAVIRAAKEWARVWAAEDDINEMTPDEKDLYAAVQTLATVFDPPADEPLAFQPATDYRPTHNDKN